MRIDGRLFLVILFLASVGARSQDRTELVYGAQVRENDRQSFHFSLEIRNPPAEEVVLEVPLWAPGAYRRITVEPRSGPLAWKQIVDVRAVDGEGRRLTVTGPAPRRFAVRTGGARTVRVTWRNKEPGKRPNNRSYLTRNAGLIDGPRSWFYLVGHKDLPAHVRFDLPPGWRVATGLDPTQNPFIFTAKDYDRLADCPTLVGEFHSWDFEVHGVPHRVCLDTSGKPLEEEPEEALEMIRRIVAANVALFGDVPYEHYTFIFTPGGGGGLEHLTSTTISVGSSRRLGMGLRGVVAHEHFHTWNVKRLRPFKLGPFDYQHDPNVADLWFCEGVTSYYTSIALMRSGLTDLDGFLRSMAGLVRTYENDPDYRLVSPEEASRMMFEQWNRMPVSFYTQGSYLGFLMDLEIRGRTKNRFGFDDVMRALYRRFGGYYRHLPPLPGFHSRDIPATIREATGVNLDEFFARHVRAAEPIAWNQHLAHAGWRLETETRRESMFRRARLSRGKGGLLIACAPGDALHAAGFRPGDRLLSVGGKEVAGTTRARRLLRALKPGDPFRVVVNRQGKEVVIKGKVREVERVSVKRIVEVPGATPAQKAVRKGIATGLTARTKAPTSR